MNVFDLFAKLSLDKSEYTEGLNEAKSEGSDFGSKIGSALGTAGKVVSTGLAVVGTSVADIGLKLANGVSEVGSYADNIDKASQKLGISAQAYQEWDFIAQHSGTSVNTLKGSMQALVKAVDSGKVSFEDISLSLEEVKSMSQEDLFSYVITQLQGMDEGVERATIAQRFLGKSAQELAPLLNTSAEATEAMRQQVHDLGGVLSDDAVTAGAGFADSLQNLQTVMQGFSRGALAEFLPSITTIMDGISDIFAGNEEGAEKIVEGVEQVLDQLIDALPKIAESGVQVIMHLVTGISETLPELIPAVVDIIVQIVTTLIDNVDLIIDGAIALIIGLAEGLVNAIPTLIEKIPTIIESLISAIIGNAPKLVTASIQLMIALGEGIIKAIPVLIRSIPKIITAIIDGLKKGIAQVKEVGMNFIEGLWNGISDKIEWIKEKISGFGKAIVDKVKDIFGVHSPSKVFASIGSFLAEGLGEGWDDEIGDVKKDIQNSLDVNYLGNSDKNTVTRRNEVQPIVVENVIKFTDLKDSELFRRIDSFNRIKTKAINNNLLANA